MNNVLKKDTSFLNVLPLYLLIFIVPFGVALQNSIMTLAVLLIPMLVKFQKLRRMNPVSKLEKIHLFLMIGFVASIIAGTLLGSNPNAKPIEALIGYLPVVFLPILLNRYFDFSNQRLVRGLEKVLFILFSIVGLITLSQYLIGWQLEGVKIVADYKRAKGFFSHPLTLAYVLQFYWIYSIVMFFTSKTRKIFYASLVVALAIALYTSMSRTVVVFAGFFLLWNIFSLLKGKHKVYALLLVALFSVAGSIIDNPIRTKLLYSIAPSTDTDRQTTEYKDDRIVFWIVHWEMIKERPLLGHGDHINKEYRTPYYDKLGFVEYEKKYEAHNQFLQIATNGGILALVFFVAWQCVLIFTMFRYRNRNQFANIAFQTLVLFNLTALTQNAFQDAEVRYSLIILITAIFAIHQNEKKSYF